MLEDALRKERLYKALKVVIPLVCAVVLGLAAAFAGYLIKGPTSAGSTINRYWFIFFAACFFCLGVLIAFRKDIAERPDIPFLLIVMAITVSTSVLFDINEPGWDTESHFKYTLAWTEPDLEVQATQAEADILTAPSISVFTSLEEMGAQKKWLNQADGVPTDLTVTAGKREVYNRIASLPSSAIYAACTALGVPFSYKYLLAKLIYAFIYPVICFLGIRRLKSGKMIYAAIAMLPAALFLASDYSYDYWVISWMLYAVAQLVGELQRPDQKLSRGRAIWLFASFVIACGPKPIYAPLVLLCLMMPRAKFETTRGSRLFRAACFVVCLGIAAAFALTSLVGAGGFSTSDNRGGSDVNGGRQLAWILSHPLEFAQVLFGFMFQYLGIDNSRYTTTALGYLSFPSRAFWLGSVVMVIVTCVTDKCDEDKSYCNWRNRLFVAVLTYGMLCLVATALYLTFTSVGANSVAGCQARYMIPCLAAPLLFFGVPRIAGYVQRYVRPYYNLACLVVLTAIPLCCIWQSYVCLIG